MARGCRGTLSERMRRKHTIDSETGCWPWHAAKDGKGYGQIRIDGKNRMATHVALELSGQPRTAEKPCALHKCDNPPCVNPAHLWWGTHKENICDARQKGRMDLSGLVIGHEISKARKQPLPIVVCANCEKQFVTSKARFQVNHRHFCGTKCCWEWQRAHFTGTARSSWAA